MNRAADSDNNTPIPPKEINTEGYKWTFLDKTTGQEEVITCFDMELAQLKAWAINPNLIMKV